MAPKLWEHLAGWYVAETGLDNSRLLVNHARWDTGLFRFALHLFTKASFRSFLLANTLVNRTGAMPVLYHLV